MVSPGPPLIRNLSLANRQRILGVGWMWQIRIGSARSSCWKRESFDTNDIASLMAWRPSLSYVDAAALLHALVWSVHDPAKMHCLALLRRWLPGCESNPFKWKLCGWGVRSGFGAPSTALRIRSCFVFMLFFVSSAHAPLCRVALASR